MRTAARTAARLLAMACLALVVVNVRALESDRTQAVYVEAGSVEIDDKSGVGVYRQGVRFTQGSIRLFADEVTVYRENKLISKVVATGEPATIRQLLENDKGEMKAQAGKIEYIASKDRIYLYGDATLQQSGDQFKGDYIEYGLQQESVIARSEDTSEDRVKIIIQPQEPVKNGSENTDNTTVRSATGSEQQDSNGTLSGDEPPRVTDRP